MTAHICRPRCACPSAPCATVGPEGAGAVQNSLQDQALTIKSARSRRGGFPGPRGSFHPPSRLQGAATLDCEYSACGEPQWAGEAAEGRSSGARQGKAGLPWRQSRQAAQLAGRSCWPWGPAMALPRQRAGSGTTVLVALPVADAELAAGELEGSAARLRLQQLLLAEQIRGKTFFS